jgi:2-aminobenzoate-CoA ligase
VTDDVMDSFARDNLPPPELWPDLLLGGPDFSYPERMNCVTELLDRWVTDGQGARPCLRLDDVQWSYADLADRVNRIAQVLTGQFGLVPGGRVMLRAPNTPMMVATYLAVIKAGGITIATMPLLRAKELAYMLGKARVQIAVCDHRLLPDMEQARALQPGLTAIIPMGGDGPDDLCALMQGVSGQFTAFDSRADDLCLIAFTSGTTGEPKGTMHFHRDMLAICDGYAKNVLRARPDDLFIGTAPLAFTFGLGAVVLFPLRIGAAAILLERASPEHLLETIRTLRPTICFTAPTAYRAMLALRRPGDFDSLRICVSAGETLPKPTWHAWHDATGIKLMDGIGATEMLHIFIAAPVETVRPGATGLPVPGYEAKLIDDDGRDLPRGSVGRLAVRGPTGCRYLADERQRKYVLDGWNVTGDTYRQDEDGYFWFQARSDDMIVSSGYNIAGPEVEAAVLTHPSVAECAVVGVPDEARGVVVKAFVVLHPACDATPEVARAIQDHVKAEIAPFKYPRQIEFCATLPKTESGKLQRFRLRTTSPSPVLHGRGPG